MKTYVVEVSGPEGMKYEDLDFPGGIIENARVLTDITVYAGVAWGGNIYLHEFKQTVP